MFYNYNELIIKSAFDFAKSVQNLLNVFAVIALKRNCNVYDNFLNNNDNKYQ